STLSDAIVGKGGESGAASPKNKSKKTATDSGPSLADQMMSIPQNMDNVWTSWMNTATSVIVGGDDDSSAAGYIPKNAMTKKKGNTKSKSAAGKPQEEEEFSQSTAAGAPVKKIVISAGDEESLRFADDEIGSFANDGYYEDIIVLDANGKPTLGPSVKHLMQYYQPAASTDQPMMPTQNTSRQVVRSRTLQSKSSKASTKNS
ncbi:MAG: hypothetical protein SGARI_005521, partial [Bacillariaceae sp.]